MNENIYIYGQPLRYYSLIFLSPVSTKLRKVEHCITFCNTQPNNTTLTSTLVLLALPIQNDPRDGGHLELRVHIFFTLKET